MNHSFLPVQQNDGIYKMAFNYSSIVHEYAKKDGVVTTLILESTHGVMTGGIEFINVQKEGTDGCLDMLVDHISDSQLQVLFYLLHLRCLQPNIDLAKIIFDANEYFKLRGITTDDNNFEKLLQDIHVLESMRFTFTIRQRTAKENNSKHIAHSVVIRATDIETDKRIIKFTLGDWVTTLSAHQYSMFHHGFFKYQLSRRDNPHTIKISLKLNQAIRNNLKRGINPQKSHCLSMGVILNTLNFNEESIRHKGFRAAAKYKFEDAMNKVASTEGYTWRYKNGNHKTFKDFKSDSIEFINPHLMSAYGNYQSHRG